MSANSSGDFKTPVAISYFPLDLEEKRYTLIDASFYAYTIFA